MYYHALFNTKASPFPPGKSLKDNNKIQNWLYRIARNAIIDHYRAQKQMQEIRMNGIHKAGRENYGRQEALQVFFL